VRWARNFIEGVGDGTDQIFHAVTDNRRYSVEFKVALLAKIPKLIEMRRIGRSVQLGGNDNHRLFDKRSAKSFQLSIDDLKRVDRIIDVGIARID